MSAMKYKNAAEILPEELVNEIRKYYPGGMLWIPHCDSDHRERDELVARLVGENVPVREVAALSKLTPRHIRRILRKQTVKQSDADTE